MNAPEFTLADQVLQWTHDPRAFTHAGITSTMYKERIAPHLTTLRGALRDARRMALDDTFLREVVSQEARLTAGPADDAELQMNAMIAMCDLARLPFKALWIEYDRGVRNHEAGKYFRVISPEGPNEEANNKRAGMLLYRARGPHWQEGNEGDPDRFAVTVFGLDYENDIRFSTANYVFGGDWGGMENMSTVLDKAACDGWGVDYDRTHIGRLANCTRLAQRAMILPDPWLVQHMINEAPDTAIKHKLMLDVVRDAELHAGDIRFVVCLLAMINYVPTKYRHVQRGGFYRKRLKNLPYLDHQVISIEAGRVRNLTKYVGTQINRALKEVQRRKGHEVRGHWRHHLNSPRCREYSLHNWTPSPRKAYEECSRCRSMRRWIDHHVRGDASLGWVSHDYLVET